MYEMSRWSPERTAKGWNSNFHSQGIETIAMGTLGWSWWELYCQLLNKLCFKQQSSSVNFKKLLMRFQKAFWNYFNESLVKAIFHIHENILMINLVQIIVKCMKSRRNKHVWVAFRQIWWWTELKCFSRKLSAEFYGGLICMEKVHKKHVRQNNFVQFLVSQKLGQLKVEDLLMCACSLLQ